jgi:hypothetical protein
VTETNVNVSQTKKSEQKKVKEGFKHKKQEKYVRKISDGMI